MAYRVPCKYPSGLGSLSSPVALHVHEGGEVRPPSRHSAFLAQATQHQTYEILLWLEHDDARMGRCLQWLIVPLSVLPMESGVIQDRRWWFLTWWYFTENLSIFFEQGIHCLKHLSRYTTHDS